MKGQTVRIVSDNENYINYLDIDLIVTHASNKGMGYDQNMYPELLCDLKVKGTGKAVPFALYDYELETV